MERNCVASLACKNGKTGAIVQLITYHIKKYSYFIYRLRVGTYRQKLSKNNGFEFQSLRSALTEKIEI